MSAYPVSRRQFLALSGAAMSTAASGRVALGTQPPPAAAKVVAGNIAFALDLYAKIREQKGNLFLSPFSISTALAMTSAGARGNTLDEMQKALHLPEKPHAAFGELLKKINAAGAKGKYELTTANAIWAQQGFPWRAEFTDLVNKNYGAGFMPVDFAGKPEAARQRINAWVEKETKEKIKELIPAGVIDALTRMVLTNAIYFKGNWASQFKKSNTKDQPFHLDGGTKAEVPLMHQAGTYSYGEATFGSGERAQVLALPYVGKELSMIVLLPEAGKLAALEAKLSAENLARWTAPLREQKVNVYLPRFKLEMDQPLFLNEPLIALGMKDAFDDEKADFFGMQSGKEVLYITAVLHKAFVDVNEEGTEAAAATGVVVGVRSAPAKPTVFRADRPFLFLIRDNATGSVLFLGRYSGPK
jgi:serpin B